MDIALRRDPEFASHLLLGVLYEKLHRTLWPNNRAGIAVCFPNYQTRPPSLGTRMRLFGSHTALDALTNTEWLNGIRDHVKVGAWASVPTGAAHRSLRRVQAQSNPERLRRRLMKRHGLDRKQAQERIPDSAAEMLELPFVQLRSRSTGQAFRLFLRLGGEESLPALGKFNAFGLSQTATVPWF